MFMQAQIHAHVDEGCCLTLLPSQRIKLPVLLSVISSGDFGSTDPAIFGASIPITAVVSTCTVHVYILTRSGHKYMRMHWGRPPL